MFSKPQVVERPGSPAQPRSVRRVELPLGTTPNAMCTLEFFGLWVIALFGCSHVALVAAVF